MNLIRRNYSFINKNPFSVGFNNRSPFGPSRKSSSPFNYITSTGPSIPSFNDPGMMPFKPEDWKAAYDTSNAVRAEHEMFKKVGQTTGAAISAAAGAISGKAPEDVNLNMDDTDDGMTDITGRTQAKEAAAKQNQSGGPVIYNIMPGGENGEDWSFSDKISYSKDDPEKDRKPGESLEDYKCRLFPGQYGCP